MSRHEHYAVVCCVVVCVHQSSCPYWFSTTEALRAPSSSWSGPGSTAKAADSLTQQDLSWLETYAVKIRYAYISTHTHTHTALNNNSIFKPHLLSLSQRTVSPQQHDNMRRDWDDHLVLPGCDAAGASCLQLQDHGVVALLERWDVQPSLILLQSLFGAENTQLIEMLFCWKEKTAHDCKLNLFVFSFFHCLVDVVQDFLATLFGSFHLFSFLFVLCVKNATKQQKWDSSTHATHFHSCSVQRYDSLPGCCILWIFAAALDWLLPVYLAMFSKSSGYFVNLCTSIGIISLSWSRRHRRSLSAS